MGYPFKRYGKHSVSEEIKHAIVTWERLRSGKQLPLADIKVAHRRFKSIYWPTTALKDAQEDACYNIGELKEFFQLQTELPWMDVLRIPLNDIEYIRNIRSKGEPLTGEPRLTLSTIHQAKGGQRDNVILMTDFSRASYEGYTKNFTAEARVFYVGASRALNSLHIVAPQTNLFFPLTQ
jgi:superfamily I DNA/RNA helicase